MRQFAISILSYQDVRLFAVKNCRWVTANNAHITLMFHVKHFKTANSFLCLVFHVKQKFFCKTPCKTAKILLY